MAGKQATDKSEGGAGEDKGPQFIAVGDGADASERAQTGDDRGDDRGTRDTDGDGGGADDDDRRGAQDRDEPEDRRAGQHDDDDRDDDDGADKGGADTRRPRLSRKERNELRRRSKERDRTEIRFLRTRNEQAEKTIMDMARRLDKVEGASVEGRIGQIKSAIARADATFVKATTAGDEAAALEATQLKNNLTERLRREEDARAEALEARRDTDGDQGGGRRGGGGDLPPAVIRNVENWMDRNPWFDPNLGDRNSKFARTLDEEVLADGFDPTSPEYYRELDRRIAEEFPHLAPEGQRRRRTNGRDRDDDDGDDRRDTRDTRGGRDDDQGDRRGGREDRDEDRGRGNGKGGGKGPRFRVGGVERALRPNEVYVSEARRQAMEEAGVWDDPKLRDKQLAAYAKWDKEHPEAAGGRVR